MRDLLIMAVILCGALYAFKRPWIGAVMSVWISLMSPHAQFGYAAGGWPVAYPVALATITGWMITKDRTQPFEGAPVLWLLAFWIWICITLPFSFYFDSSFGLWTRSMKIFLLVMLTLALVNTRKKLDWLIYTVVISLGFYGVKGGIFTVLTGGNFRVWGPPSGFAEGNNELALALVMVLPLVRYVHLHAANVWGRRAALGTMCILPLTILGSHSRGALLALGAMGAFLWWKSDRKLIGGPIMLALAVGALAFMPEHWWSRMETIKTYEDDGSAQGRINAWWNAWNLAKSNFFGGGFMIYTPAVFAKYSPEPDKVHAAHSIYFQVLGEHGFVGIFLFLAIGASTWLTCRRLIKLSAADPGLKWARDLGAMTQVSMIGFAVGGAFLSLAYYDLPYDIMAIVVIALRIVVRHVQGVAAGLPDAAARADKAPQSLPPHALASRQRVSPRGQP